MKKTLIAAMKAALAAAVVACVSAVAGAARAQEPAAVTFPGSAVTLQDGDILLDTGPTVSNFLLSDLGRPAGKYAHANVYVVIPGEGGRLVHFDAKGVHVIGTGKVFEENYYLALVRPRSPPDPGRLAEALEALRNRPLAFDYAMRWPETDGGQTYCAGFISQLYRLAGLPDPFPPFLAGRQEAGDVWMAEQLGIDPSRSVSPNAPLFLPAFELVAEYRNTARRIADGAAVNRVIAGKVKEYVTGRHLIPVASGLGAKLVLAVAGAGAFDIGNVPLDAMRPRQRSAFLAIATFGFMVKSRVDRTVALEGDRDWSEAAVAALVDSVADAYRDRYFVKEAAP